MRMMRMMKGGGRASSRLYSSRKEVKTSAKSDINLFIKRSTFVCYALRIEDITIAEKRLV